MCCLRFDTLAALLLVGSLLRLGFGQECDLWFEVCGLRFWVVVLRLKELIEYGRVRKGRKLEIG